MRAGLAVVSTSSLAALLAPCGPCQGVQLEAKPVLCMDAGTVCLAQKFEEMGLALIDVFDREDRGGGATCSCKRRSHGLKHRAYRLCYSHLRLVGVAGDLSWWPFSRAKRCLRCLP